MPDPINSSPLSQPITVGSVTLPNRAFLAPLAGVSDVPFRRICRELGAGLTFIEMLSAEALLQRSPRTRAMMARHADESVLGVQVSGPSVESVTPAVHLLDKAGLDLIDINMGCPVKKIVSAGWGSAFLRDPARVSDTVAAARAATRRPLTVKCRLGYSPDAINVEDISGRVAAAEADMLTLHGRTRADTYAVPVDYAPMRRGFDRARARRPLVLTGNGDVFDFASALRMITETGCHAVMVSRGALGHPWIFRRLLEPQSPPPSLEEWADVVLRHLDYQQAFYGDDPQAARRMRKHLAWYARGFPGISAWRARCVEVNSLADAREWVRAYAASRPGHWRQNEDRPESSADPKHDMDRGLDRGVSPEEERPRPAVID